MTTVSVALPTALNNYVAKAVRRGKAPNKAAFIRLAVERYAEDETVKDVHDAEQEMREGKIKKKISSERLNAASRKALNNALKDAAKGKNLSPRFSSAKEAARFLKA